MDFWADRFGARDRDSSRVRQQLSGRHDGGPGLIQSSCALSSSDGVALGCVECVVTC